ncbi:hypothetical protein BGX28_004085 [Mortierella sp. GBA30]|nr:hypothetical protein BGX28_004085 [Mortierella sp. GBA30]
MSAYNGTDIVVFEGQNDGSNNSTRTPTLLTLDIVTMIRTKGKDVAANQTWSGMVCAVADDNFVAWGGDRDNAATNLTTIVYNMRKNMWTNEFIINPVQYSGAPPSWPSIAPATPSGSPSASGSSSSSTMTNVAAIGGGVGAAIVVQTSRAF